jgi:Fuc2NAc and GlcNAc transferase
MSAHEVLLPAASLLLAAAGTELLRRYALSYGVLDQPNARSSHQRPTPRGGGLAVVVAFVLALSWLCWQNLLTVADWAGLCGGSIALAATGFADDHRPLSPGLRWAVHWAAAAWALYLFGRGMSIDFSLFRLRQPWLVLPLAALVVVWMVNLFNFMDGIDGIAGSEALFVALLTAAWLAQAGAGPGWVLAALALAAASAGFLTRNWPPAKIFMGDVGSGFLGFALSALMIGGVAHFDASPWPWLISIGVFFVDATYTLFHRLRRRQRLADAHRSHAYQILSRRWGGHRPVTLACAAINLLWLAPLAAAAAYWRAWGPLLWGLALLPLVLIAWRTNAGGTND